MISKYITACIIGTTDADKEISGKIISKFEICVNLYSRREFSFRRGNVIF